MNNEILHKIFLLLAAPMSEADVQHLFTLARKLIGRAPKGDRKQFALLKFYCDWTMHPDIDRSDTGASILADAHNIIADHLQKKDNSTLVADLTAALSLSTVRTQLNNLLEYFDSSPGSPDIDETKWAEIKPIIVEIIAHCPLKIDLKNPRFEAVLRTIQSRPLKGSSVLDQLMIVKIPSTTFNPKAPPDEITYCISLRATDTTSIIAPLL
jgi:hypothetical protein